MPIIATSNPSLWTFAAWVFGSYFLPPSSPFSTLELLVEFCDTPNFSTFQLSFSRVLDPVCQNSFKHLLACNCCCCVYQALGKMASPPPPIYGSPAHGGYYPRQYKAMRSFRGIRCWFGSVAPPSGPPESRTYPPPGMELGSLQLLPC